MYENWLLVTLSAFTASFLLVWVYIRIKMYRMIDMAEKLPGPRTLPFIGNALDVGRNLKEMFMICLEMCNKYDSIVRMWLGPILAVGLLDSEYVETVLSATSTQRKPWSYKFLEPWLGQGLLTSSGEKWRIHRKLITPAFHFKMLEKFVDVFNSNVDVLTKQLSSHVDGPEFDIFHDMTLCALDNISETAMGVNINAQNNSSSEYVQAIPSLCKTVLKRSMKLWLYPDFLFRMSSIGKCQQKCLDILHSMTNKIIKARKQELLHKQESETGDNELDKKKKIPFLDLLIMSSQNGSLLTDEELREEVDTFMFEGHDTTASAMSFTCYMLANHQDVQDKVVAELKEIFDSSDRPPTYNDLQKMKYLEQAIKETLRLYPSVPVIGRYCAEDLKVGDYTIPAGANVLIPIFALHRKEKYFPDPDKFDPDRFLPDNIQMRPVFSFIPFAAGPRNCIGQKFAMLEIKATVSQLLRRYRLMPGTSPLQLMPDIVLKTVTGINIRIERR
ncbi:cytochrome P450 4C1-like [Periplaneta americana]|uniref:cytochrome P450 4C1-like n=1 Tax=Periplaneta americana TaxID=6978 RepID=UPI0037E825D8